MPRDTVAFRIVRDEAQRAGVAADNRGEDRGTM